MNKEAAISADQCLEEMEPESFISDYFSSNSSHEKSREYQRVYRDRSVGAETPARLVALEVLHKFSLGYNRFVVI